MCRAHRFPGVFWDKTDLVETFPRFADLTGQDLVFSKQNTAHPPTLACVAYVKLAPLSQTEVEAIQRDRGAERDAQGRWHDRW